MRAAKLIASRLPRQSHHCEWPRTRPQASLPVGNIANIRRRGAEFAEIIASLAEAKVGGMAVRQITTRHPATMAARCVTEAVCQRADAAGEAAMVRRHGPVDRVD